MRPTESRDGTQANPSVWLTSSVQIYWRCSTSFPRAFGHVRFLPDVPEISSLNEVWLRCLVTQPIVRH